MELRPVCVFLWLTGLIRCTQTGVLKATLRVQSGWTQVFRGESVTLKCDIEGGEDKWTYSWYKNGAENPTIKQSENTFEVSDEATFTCMGNRIGGDPQSTEMSDPVTLSMLGKPKPTVSVNPQSSVYTGDRVTLTCNLLSTGWTFLWYKDYQESNPLSPGTTDTNTLSVTVTNEGVTQYYCKAQRGNYDSEISDPATITVRVRPKPAVKVQPAERVFIGETVTLTCEIQTGESWRYLWYRNNEELSDAAGKKTHTITDIEESNKGDYTCKGTQSSDPEYTQASDAVTLTVSENPKPELTSDLKGAVLTGNSVTLSCTLKPQSAGWKFCWIKTTQSTETETETKTQYYTIRSVNVSDEGQYRCRAGRGNPVYYTDYSDALWVNVTESPKPVVTIKPDKHVFRGETVTLRCEIQGGGDTEWTYSWYKNYYTLYIFHTTQEFGFRSVRNDNSGKYTCRGRRNSDSQRSEISDAVTLTVSDVAEAVVSVSPLCWLTEGDSVTLSCEVKNSSTGWTFSWYTEVPSRNGLIKMTGSPGNVLYGSKLLSDSSRGSGGSYTLSPVTVKNTGVYMCSAERGESVFHTRFSNLQPLWITGASSRVSLIINPSRTQHFTADSLSLSCEDQSDSTGWTVRGYTYNETLFECSSVSGSTCNISSLSTSHTGVYWCHSESGRRSNPVNITVHNGDVILESPVHPVTEGRPLILRCLHRNSKISDFGVNFYKNDSVLQSQTTAAMTISTVSKSDEGFYHCKHPERGESPKSWISVRASDSGSTGVIIGLRLAFLFVILMIVLILLLHFKKKKGVEYQTPSTVNQDTNQPADGDNIYENADIRTTEDSAAGTSSMNHSQDVHRNKTQNDAAAGLSDVTYADIELKNQKKPKRKQGKSSEGADTVYSELKQNTDKVIKTQKGGKF
ncbi:carcinoembryonic antigen-related cell adhesion molecule 5 isoform X1 [Ictalurus punctatus]|uniref:Carcinoembryonic antigen-related cell adhesion molecule 5 isoform X1 n=1 Tax=Ictalurus punctatus TaxID=7998 RepID=A0A9F7R2A4_ICTPU|nr:carcinoembryonic antigen-related cell adhesion molecule 5 isoform X1 [Ictalurus punctatus]XP_053537484.1 carcinoembryonic antigen-related cell adhesion molecule 5 isoform X1 [Ictalurus punctatus]XP_053537485.1 carcinoembryonic antigen-related cell adhesion molecule 5 isoform X1 [Ictalurus punctatus]XP_053537486.1 carcinoembryonic antigen-related cell adhesion molecule 5 isoform X1 [Ictalurus punctatus]XP_053537487.1 carcinoembryonic antigen-related cell adhesion molecule 5 isoform X1 [Ictalu